MAAAGKSAAAQFYRYWGLFLARNGYAVFAIEYRLGKAGVYPAAVYDAKAAIQFVRAKAAEFDLDPERIGLIGDFAGAHLAALVALAGDQFNVGLSRRRQRRRSRPTSKRWSASTASTTCTRNGRTIWSARPNDKIVEKFLGASPMENRRIYFEASPISYATVDRNQVRFLLIHGTDDDIVDPPTQSEAFLTALAQAGIFRAPDRHSRRRAFLVVRSVRRRAAQL